MATAEASAVAGARPVTRAAGHRVAQLGAVLMIAGGVFDMSLGELLPHHAAVLAAGYGAVPPEAAGLILALLRALGGALAAVGIAVLILLRFGSRTGSRLAYAGAALTAVIAEGPNVLGILSTGSPLFVAPLAFMLLVVAGSALCYRALHRGVRS